MFRLLMQGFPFAKKTEIENRKIFFRENLLFTVWRVFAAH